MTETIESDVIREIERGAFRHCYLVYNRKSTDEPNNQKNSLKYQNSENLRLVLREHLPVAAISIPGFCRDGIISEKHSGFKEDAELVFGKGGTVQYRIERPKFYRLVEFLNKGYFKGAIFLCWDRASRNKGDNNIIDKLMKLGVDFRFTLASYDKTSSGALHMDIDGMVAQHHSRVTSEKVTLNIRNQRSKGICTFRAPVGYLNPGSMEHKPFDPERAPMIVQLFERYDTGEWSLSDLARWANAQGYTMSPSRLRRTAEEMLAEEADDEPVVTAPVCRPMRVSSIQRILTNPFYTGRIMGNDGTLIMSASHAPLISDELFTRVQTRLRKKNVSIHYTNKLASPYRGMVRCGGCSRIYTPYTQKGIRYFASKCTGVCLNTVRNFNISFLEREIGRLVERLSFTDEEMQELDRKAQTEAPEMESQRNKEAEQMERQLRKLREDLTYLQSNKLPLLRAGIYTPETYIEEEIRITGEMASMKKSDASSASILEIIEDAKKLSELLKTLYLTYKKAGSFDRERIARKLFSELSFLDNTLNYKCKKGIQILENRFFADGAQGEWISELIANQEQIRRVIEELESTEENDDNDDYFE